MDGVWPVTRGETQLTMPDYLPYDIGYTMVCRCRSSSSPSSYSVLRLGNSLSQSELFRVRASASASSFKLQYDLVSSRSYNSCLRLLPHLPISFFLSSFQVWRYSSLWALESLKNASIILCIQPFLAHPRVPGICNTSLWNTSSDLISGFPLSVM